MRLVSLQYSSDGKTFKINFTHTCVGGTVWTFSLPGSIWYITSHEPLSIMPTITCGRCQLKGWFRKGEWEDAPNPYAGPATNGTSSIASVSSHHQLEDKT